jgi:hypothetical protein
VGSGGWRETAFVNPLLSLCERFCYPRAVPFPACLCISCRATRAVSNHRARHVNSLGYVGLSAHSRPFRCQVRKSLPRFLDSLNPVCDQILSMIGSNFLIN